MKKIHIKLKNEILDGYFLNKDIEKCGIIKFKDNTCFVRMIPKKDVEYYIVDGVLFSQKGLGYDR